MMSSGTGMGGAAIAPPSSLVDREGEYHCLNVSVFAFSDGKMKHLNSAKKRPGLLVRIFVLQHSLILCTSSRFS